MKRLPASAALLLSMTASRVVHAQQIEPAGVVAAHRASSARDVFRPELRRPLVADSTPGHPWRWVGTGALLGTVAGGLAVGTSISRTDDAMLAGPAMIVGAGAGAVVGGLVGGFFYLISHSTRQSADLDPSRESSRSATRNRAHRQHREK